MRKFVDTQEYIDYVKRQAVHAFNVSAVIEKHLTETYGEMNIVERFVNRKAINRLLEHLDIFQRLFSSYSREVMYGLMLQDEKEDRIQISDENEFFENTEKVLDMYEMLYGKIELTND